MFRSTVPSVFPRSYASQAANLTKEMKRIITDSYCLRPSMYAESDFSHSLHLTRHVDVVTPAPDTRIVEMECHVFAVGTCRFVAECVCVCVAFQAATVARSIGRKISPEKIVTAKTVKNT